MNTELRPVNKQSSLFLSRKRRIETVNEALEKFACEVTSPATSSKVREMLFKNSNGDDTEVTLTIKIRSDAKTPNLAIASVDIRLSTRMGSESFYGLA
jgi:hypothetical protein